MAAKTEKKAATGVKAETKTVAVADLVLDPGNPRTHGKRNLDLIEASLAEFGQLEPLIVQAGTLRVIAGHGRIEALRKLGVAKAEVRVVHVDEITARRLAVILNRSAELAGWDIDNLQAVLDDLEEVDIDAEAIGFSDEELEQLAKLADEEPEDRAAKTDAYAQLKDQYQVLVNCANEHEQKDLLQKLSDEGWSCRALNS